MRSIGFTRRSSLAFTLSFAFLLGGCAPSSIQDVADACSKENKRDSRIENFCVVTPDVLWRGAKPDQDGAAWLIQQGLRTMVNLELLHDDRSVFRQAKLANADKYEVGYFRVRDWEPNPIIAPKLLDSHIAHFLAVVSQQPKPIYVHCRSGQNRTGVMVAAYRVIVEGASADEAIKEMKRYQGSWFVADAGYIRGLSPERREEIRLMVKEWIPKLKAEAQIVCEHAKCDVSDR